MTDKQFARSKRNRDIVSKFNSLRKKHPDISIERIFQEIAKDYTITSGAIRVVCKRAGVC